MFILEYSYYWQNLNRNFLIRLENKQTQKSCLIGKYRLKDFVSNDLRLFKFIIRAYHSNKDSTTIEIFGVYRIVFISR